MKAVDRSFLRVLFGFGCAITMCVSTHAQSPTPGQNINMVSGTKWPGGDPFLQRQNEPSIALSTRNPLHLLAGANDYRTVDLPLTDVLPNSGLAGDAWLGLFKSFNGGQTWQSTLIPGYPQDQTTEGLASPLKGFTTASDPAVRAGTNGLFYYAGIAFNRGTNQGVVFVSRLIDLNNKENGNAAPADALTINTDPIRYVGTVAIDSATGGQFLDKPWIAVDVPRFGAGTCTLQVSQPGQPGGTVTQSFAAGNVYLAYTKITTDQFGNVTSSQILFSRSLDCGATWSPPIPLTASDELDDPNNNSINQGAAIQVDPQVGFVYVAWRRFRTAYHPDSIMGTASIDGGRTFFPSIPIVTLPPFDPNNPTAPSFFDQGTTFTSFRTNAFPALAVDDNSTLVFPGLVLPGRIYLAWSQRGVGPNGDARIMMMTSPDMTHFPPVPFAIDNGPLLDDFGTAFARGHQFMPQMTYTGGKLMVLYYDERLDHTSGVFTPASPFPPFLPDVQGRFFLETRQPKGELPSSPGTVFTPFVDDLNPPLSLRRHTIDVTVAEASPGPTPTFTTARVSRYKFGTRPGIDTTLQQLQVNPPNLPLFKGGTVPFFGDYLDIAGLMFVPNIDGSWRFNTPPLRAPVHFATWTTNQDVRPPANGNWTDYTPVTLPGSQTSTFDPSQQRPLCKSGNEGMRNQNIYSSRITEGLLVSSPQNSKPLSSTVQRAFVVLVQNFTNFDKSFRLTIANQPPGSPTTGTASFVQVANTTPLPPLPVPTTTLDVTIAAHSGIARPVFALSSSPTASITVNVAEITAPGPGGTPVSGGLTSFVVLNPDGTVPQLINPDSIAPCPTGQTCDISLAELYTPDISNPDISNPNKPNMTISSPDISNPDISNPDISNPDISNPDISNPGILTPDISNPHVANPDISNPDISNPLVSDATYTVINRGNTIASYKIRLVGSAPPSARLQLVLNKTYLTPAPSNCQLIQQSQNILQANVLKPAFSDASNLANPDISNPDISNPTVSLAPGESARITLRGNVDVPTMRTIVTAVAPVVVAHAANTGTTTPQVAAPLFITTSSLPDGVRGKFYIATLTAIGGTPPYTFTSSLLPSGLTLSPTEGFFWLISGTPLASNLPGSSIAFQVQDSGSPARTFTRNLTLRIAEPLVVTTTGLPAGVVNSFYTTNLTATGGIQPLTWTTISGLLPPGLSLSGAGLISGTPTALGTFNFIAQVTDSASPTPSTATQSLSITVVAILISTPATLPSGVVGKAYSVTLQANGGTLPYTWSVSSGSLPGGLTLNPSTGVISGTPTTAGNFSFTIQVKDSASPTPLTATVTFTISITNPVPVFFGQATDPLGDAIGGGTNPDLVWGSVTTFNNGSVKLAVRYAAGTFNSSTTEAQFLLDTDQNPATGSPGSNAGCISDASSLGTDYLVVMQSGFGNNQARISKATGGCNAFVQLGTAPVTIFTDGMDVTFPLSLLTNTAGPGVSGPATSGPWNFKVTTDFNAALGVPLPATGTTTLTQGGAPVNADTYVTPFVATQGLTITSWKVQFQGGSVTAGCAIPVGIQLKILRQTAPNTLTVQSAGTVFNPLALLQARFNTTGCPSFANASSSSVLQFTDSGLAVSAGDFIGVTVMSDPTVNLYFLPLASVSGNTRTRLHENTPVGGTILLTDTFTGTLPNQAPAFFAPANTFSGLIDTMPNIGLAPAFTASSPLPITPPSGMVAWYPADGYPTDIQNNHGGVFTNITFAPSEVGQSFVFDGTSSSITITDSGDLTPPAVTVDFWFKSNVGLSGSPVVPFLFKLNPADDANFSSKGYDFFYQFGGPGFGLAGPGGARFFAQFSASFTAGTWHHVAGTYDPSAPAGTAQKLYLDGALVSSTCGPSTTGPTFNPSSTNCTPAPINYQPAAIEVGRVIDTANFPPSSSLPYFFNGQIDEIEIFNRALSASEIQAIFNAGSAGKAKP